MWTKLLSHNVPPKWVLLATLASVFVLGGLFFTPKPVFGIMDFGACAPGSLPGEKCQASANWCDSNCQWENYQGYCTTTPTGLECLANQTASLHPGVCGGNYCGIQCTSVNGNPGYSCYTGYSCGSATCTPGTTCLSGTTSYDANCCTGSCIDPTTGFPGNWTAVNGSCQCVAPSHYACSGTSCTSVRGSGTNSCTSNSDCSKGGGGGCTPIVPCSQLGCGFSDSCGNNCGSCSCTPPITCTQCIGSCGGTYGCTGVNGVSCGGGPCPSCPAGQNCVNHQCIGGGGSHLACSGTSCVSVSGPGTNSCTTNADCGGGGGCRSHPDRCQSCQVDTNHVYSSTGCYQLCTDGCDQWSQACSASACCVDTSWSCVMPYNGTEESNCGHTRSNPACVTAYFQAAGASVHSNGSISGISDTYIPNGTYFNQLAAGFYGVVSSGGSFSFSPSKTNSKLWQLQNYPSAGASILQNPRYDHNYFWNAFGDKVVTTINANQVTSGDLQTSGTAPVILAIHPISGNSVSIANPINVVGGKLLVVFVDSSSDPTGTPVNLALVPGGSVRVDSQSMIIWIVSGNITIDSSISQADGYWLSSGSFSDGTGQTQLNISGGVAAYGGVSLERRNSNNSQPSELINYNPSINLLAPVIGTSTYSWSEISP